MCSTTEECLDAVRISELLMLRNTLEGTPIMRVPSVTSEDELLIWKGLKKYELRWHTKYTSNKSSHRHDPNSICEG